MLIDRKLISYVEVFQDLMLELLSVFHYQVCLQNTAIGKFRFMYMVMIFFEFNFRIAEIHEAFH